MASKVGLSILLVVLLAVSVAAKIKFDPLNKIFVDEQGNSRIFHGVNVAYKSSPYLPPNTDSFDFDKSFSEQDAQMLQNWGMNIIRLTFYWEAVEPVRGVYNQTYIDNMKRIVEICAKFDIHVFLDLHQDVASKKFCGEGMPDWAVKDYDSVLTKFPAPLYNFKIERDAQGYPTLESCLKNVFAEYYFTYAVEDTFKRLYTNDDGIRDNFANMWQTIATNFKDYENVIGYEIINEPWVGNLYQDPSQFVHDKYMLPFYQAVNTAIRQVDNQSIIFYERPITDTVGVAAFKGTPGGPEYADRQILSYHIYAVAKGDPTNIDFTDLTVDILFQHAFAYINENNVGGMLTEFGAISGQNKPGLINIRKVTSMADKKLHSWAYWQYKYYDDYTTAARPSEWEGFFDDQGNVITAKVKEISRPYVVKSPLTIMSMHFDAEKVEFTAEFRNNGNHGDTEIFFSEDFHFSNGVSCSLKECLGCQFRKKFGVAKNLFVLDHSQAIGNELILKCKSSS
jgi:endoglycosylceramidase